MIKIVENKWPKWLTSIKLCARYGSGIKISQYEKMKEKKSFRCKKLKHKRHQTNFLHQPLRAMIATMQMKGCNKWKRKFLKNKTQK